MIDALALAGVLGQGAVQDPVQDPVQGPATEPAPAGDEIGGRPYVKLATREATEKAMRAQWSGPACEWGPWRWIGPFALPGGSKSIAMPLPPEDASASGATLDGSGWRELDGAAERGGADGFAAIDLRQFSRQERIVGYLARSVVVPKPTKLSIEVGSDDGLRLWLDGELLIDAPIERGFDDDEHVLELSLAAGSHELLAKIAQDAGGWSFRLAPRVAYDRVAEAQLSWRLQHDFPDRQSRHWKIAPIPVPESAAFEVGGLDVLPDGRPIACTRRGDVYVLDGAFDLPPRAPTLTLFASGLHEPLGLAVRPDPRSLDGWSIVLAHRPELTRLYRRGDLSATFSAPSPRADATSTHSLRADTYETLCDAWHVSGNYHEYAFGPRFDDDGCAWVTLNLGHTNGETVMGAPVPTRGCAVRIAPDGSLEVVADGLRSPDGIGWLPGLGAAYTDNQGDYVATNKLALLLPASFHGHQSTLPWRATEPGVFAGSTWKKGDAAPAAQPPAIWFPYEKMGQSASDLIVDTTNGAFGPFAGQILVGDQTHATIMRVALERVTTPDGEVVQGACFPFLSGFKSGVHRLCFAQDGSLLVGLTDRGWASRGGWRDGLERVIYGGEPPFEVAAIRAQHDGFELELTQDADAATATALDSYAVSSWTYEYHPDYGSPEIDTAPRRVVAARLVTPRKIALQVGPLRAGYVHEIAAAGLRSSRGEPLLHETAWYTMQQIPAAPKDASAPTKQ